VGAVSASCGISGAYVTATQFDLFRGPEGARGPAGPPGPSGPQGEQGPAGQAASGPDFDGMWFVARSCGWNATYRGQVVSGVRVWSWRDGSLSTNVDYLQLCEPN